MAVIIDFDDASTFPEELGNLSIDFRNMILSKINANDVTAWWEIRDKLNDLHINEMSIVKDYLDTHMESEVAVSHCTRILDIDQFKKEGLISSGGRGSVADTRLRNLLSSIGVDKVMEERIMSKVYFYWERDKINRTKGIHFQFDRNNIYKDDTANVFAINLGGEILRWALESCDKGLYKKEPYKRLWIRGTPSIVKFRCKLSDFKSSTQAQILAEIVKYNIVTKLYGYPYEFSFTGKTADSVPAENIISIEEIKGYIGMQEKYEDPGFYDELK